MTSYDPDLICTRKDDVLLLTLNRGSKANSLTPTLVEDLITALDQPDNVRMAVIRGEGKHFCAGFDLSDISGCCQTNEPKHQYSFNEYLYEVTKERHSVRAASRLSLNVLRFESDLCELNKL